MDEQTYRRMYLRTYRSCIRWLLTSASLCLPVLSFRGFTAGRQQTLLFFRLFISNGANLHHSTTVETFAAVSIPFDIFLT